MIHSTVDKRAKRMRDPTVETTALQVKLLTLIIDSLFDKFII